MGIDVHVCPRRGAKPSASCRMSGPGREGLLPSRPFTSLEGACLRAPPAHSARRRSTAQPLWCSPRPPTRSIARQALRGSRVLVLGVATRIRRYLAIRPARADAPPRGKGARSLSAIRTCRAAPAVHAAVPMRASTRRGAARAPGRVLPRHRPDAFDYAWCCSAGAADRRSARHVFQRPERVKHKRNKRDG